MKQNIKIAKELIKLAKNLIANDIADKNEVEKYENKLDNEALELFEEFKKEASIQTNIKFASDESKAKKMIKKALEKAKSLSGTTLKTFLLATIAFISLYCNIAKADVINLDNSNTLQKISQSMKQNKNTVTSKDFEGSNLNIAVNHLSKFMNRQDAKKFKESINNYINKNDISNKKVK
jgi:hypothetical protein